MEITSKNVLRGILWILGFIGFAGIAIFWNTISKPWINFSIGSIRYDTNEYQEITFRNTSKNINLQGELEIPISKDEKLKKQIETGGLLSTGRYTANDSSITVYLGKEQEISLVCVNCNINKSSIKNLTPENFSLKECYMDDRDCLWQSKFYSLLDNSFPLFTMLFLLIYFLISSYKKLVSPNQFIN